MMGFIYIVFVFIIGFFMAERMAKQMNSNMSYLVFVTHMLFSFLYFVYAKTHSADANMYYYKGLKEQDILFLIFGTGTDFIIFLSAFFQKLGFDKLSLFFLFGLFGFVGFTYLIKILPNIQKTFFNVPLLYIILLLPGFHFWTSALGKDSLFFMVLMMFFYSIQKLPSRLLMLGFSFLTIALIRPHMGFILLMSSLIALFFRNPTKFKSSHLLIGFVAIIVLIIFLPFVLQFLDIEQMQMEQINSRLEDFTSYGAKMTDDVSSYVDMSNASILTKLFAYLFRPLFFDVHSAMQLAASFENLLLLFIIIAWLKAIKFKVFKWYKMFNISEKIMVIYVLLAWLILAMGMYNLGLASRQKYMLMPVIFILIFDTYYLQYRNYIFRKIRKSNFKNTNPTNQYQNSKNE